MTTLPVTQQQPLPSQILSLIEKIQLEIEQGKERAQLAMESENRQTFWNIGMYVKEHLMQNADRAEYGKHIFKILAENTVVSRTNLYLAVQFYVEYPQIVRMSGQLTWSHYTKLLTIPDTEQRQKYEEQIVAEKLSYRDFKSIVTQEKRGDLKASDNPKLAVERGTPFTYKLKKIQDKLVVDLGFRIYAENPCKGFTEESIISSEKINQKYKFQPITNAINPHYVYKAYFLEAIDGDTIWADIDLGFGVWTTQRLRFRGINTQGLETKTGKTAREVVESKLSQCPFIAVRTYWRDKFTRYLADIFYSKTECDYYSLTQNGNFLNQELLDSGLAIKY